MKHTDKFVIYAQAGEYTLLKRKGAELEPYVVAWKFNGKDWCQGHYFQHYNEALTYLHQQGKVAEIA